MDNYKWGKVTLLPDGHRLFYGVEDDSKLLVAIADNSGREPQDTDDGILLLDFDRKLRIAHSGAGVRHAESFFIPLINDAGEESSTITDAATLMALSAEFTWPIEDQVGLIYTVKLKENM